MEYDLGFNYVEVRGGKNKVSGGVRDGDRLASGSLVYGIWTAVFYSHLPKVELLKSYYLVMHIYPLFQKNLEEARYEYHELE